jgi:hypothetical protein
MKKPMSFTIGVSGEGHTFRDAAPFDSTHKNADGAAPRPNTAQIAKLHCGLARK